MHGVAWVAVQTLASEAARTGLGEINGGLIELLAPVRATPRKHCKKITGRVYNTAHNYCTSCFACSLERERERDMCVCVEWEAIPLKTLALIWAAFLGAV